jgi:hypothetical protein
MGGNALMAQPKRHHVRFKAEKKISKPVRVEFEKKDGSKVEFPAHKKVTKKVKIDFMADAKKK